MRVHGVVLAGAHDWEGSSFQQLGPRALLPVAQTPLICFALRWLASGAVDQATICANSAVRSIRQVLGDGTSLSMSLGYREDWTPRGPAGCARDAAVSTDAETFVVLDGSTIPTAGLRGIIEAHLDREAAVTVVASQVDLPMESPLTPCGIYVFQRHALEAVSPRGFQDIKESLIPGLHESGEAVIIHAIPGGCPRVMNAATYLAVNNWLVARFAWEGNALDGYRSVGEALMHSTATVAKDAHLVGPVLVGPAAKVGSRATVVGPTSIGASSRIEAGACVARSAVWDRCVVGNGAFVDQSILADDTVVPEGCCDLNALRYPKSPRGERWPPARAGANPLTRWTGTEQPRPDRRIAASLRSTESAASPPGGGALPASRNP